MDIPRNKLGILPEISQLSSHVRDLVASPSMGVDSREICGPNQYVRLAQMSGSDFVEGCAPCSDLDGGSSSIISRPLEEYLGATPSVSTNPTRGDINSVDRFNSANANVWDSLRTPEMLGRMCHSTPDIYVPAQYNANPYKQHRNIVWTDILPINSNYHQDLYLKWFDDRQKLSDTDIINLYDYHNRSRDLPDNITSPSDLKQAITSTRGSLVRCVSNPSTGNNISFTSEQLTIMNVAPTMCPGGRFGPENIIYEEYNDWKHQNDQRSAPSPMVGDFSQLYTTFESNPRFEDCMNRSFSDRITDSDRQQISEIESRRHFRELTDQNIQYIKKKMNLFLIDSNKELIVDCVKNDLYFDVSICNAGLSEQILKILQTILYIVGFDFRSNQIETEADKDRLTYIIDELGDYIPRVLDSILDVSERYESLECNGITSHNTRILRELHTQMFHSGTNVINFDLGLSHLTSSATTDTEFTRTTILAMLAITFLKYF